MVNHAATRSWLAHVPKRQRGEGAGEPGLHGIPVAAADDRLRVPQFSAGLNLRIGAFAEDRATMTDGN